MVLNKPEIFVKAPGRICLFGDHQDYLGLPIIACAINKYIYLEAKKRQDQLLDIYLADMNQKRVIDLKFPYKPAEEYDYLISSLIVLAKHGIEARSGYTISIRGDIPINAGLSSSSALVVAWIRFLLKAFGNANQQSPEFVARLAYEAEVLEYNSPGGLMDQYTISLGELIYLNTINGSYSFIDKKIEALIIGESGVPKKTLGILATLRTKAQRAVQQVANKIKTFSLESASLDDIRIYENHIDDELRPYFYAALKNYAITKQAMQVLSQDPVNLQKLGKLMYEHHEVLRDILKITVPIIDKMIDAAMSHGAYGAKIVGSGGGGCIVALSSIASLEQVAGAIKKAGAKEVYKINLSKGAHTYQPIL